jgi:uncharacterized protein
MGKIQTSIPQLDELMDGGLDEGKFCLFWVQPGLDVNPFLYQIADSIVAKRKLFYVINSKSPTTLKQEQKSYGFNRKINFVDAYSGLVGTESSEKLLINNPRDFEELFKDIQLICKKIKNPVIILDSLSTLIDLTEKETVEYVTKLKSLGATILCSFTQWAYKPKFLKDLKKESDTVVNIKSVEDKLFLRQYFGVSKLAGKDVEEQAIPFRFERPGGIKIFIPKVLVTGPFNAGKTSFIHSSSTRAVSVDRLGTTIALDHGHVKYKNFAVDLFGTPGQQRFDPILKLLGQEALGVIVVVSSTDPLGFPRALDMVEKAKVIGLPVIFAANKSNLRGAMKVKDIQKKLGVSDGDVIPVTAKDLTKVQPGLPCQLNEKDIESVLGALFKKLLQGGK